MAPTPLFPTIIFSLFISFIPPSNLHHVKGNDSFGVRLIHPYSPLSPFYDPRMTKLDRIISAANHSLSRLHYLHSRASLSVDFSPNLIPERGGYLMMYYLGNPPTQLVYAIADTGSDLVWLQCSPCQKCYKQDLPIFSPSKSTSFIQLPCGTPDCNRFNRSECRVKGQPCRYTQNYIDGSETKGVLSRDLFHFDDPKLSKPNVFYLAFGCSNYTTTRSMLGKQAGVVGLNRQPLSFISQLGIRTFSYCIVSPEQQGSGSRMYFGSEAVISGGQTPLKGFKHGYYLTLNGISVGDEEVSIPGGIFEPTEWGEGGFAIDSGSTYTVLRSEAYDALVETLMEEINLPQKERTLNVLEVCFEGSFDDLDLQPDVTFHFENTDVILMKQSTYLEVESGVWCLAMLPSDRKLSLFGNYQQQNFWVGYDLENEMISFAPVNCAIF